jgi:hypothetical protein
MRLVVTAGPQCAFGSCWSRRSPMTMDYLAAVLESRLPHEGRML